MTRILVSGIERTNAAIRRRWTCGFCDVTQSVSSPVPGETDAMHARGSIAFGMSRWLRSAWCTTVAADLNAAAVAGLSPIGQWQHWFFGLLANGWGDPVSGAC